MNSGMRKFEISIMLIGIILFAAGLLKSGFCDPEAPWSPENQDGNRLLFAAWSQTDVLFLNV